MFGKKKRPGISALTYFTPFTSLNEQELIIVAEQSIVKEVKEGVRLLKLGDKSKNDFFLLKGSLLCKSSDGTEFIINGNTEASRQPIAKIRPSLYEVTALASSVLMILDASITRSAQKEAPPKQISLADRIEAEQSAGRKIFLQIYEDLANNKLVLPSIPNVALKVRKLIDSGNVGSKEISAAINVDPAMATKIVKAANSPLYRGATKIESISQAVVRLGLTVTRQLVLSFAMHDIFKIDNKHLQILMNQLWQHSVDIASTCFVLSKKLKILSPEEALLTGLLHDIGAIPIILNAHRYEALIANPEELQHTIDSLKGELGGAILKKWLFPDSVVNAARDAEHWIRETSEVDYCDLIIVSQLQALSEDDSIIGLPRLRSTPSFTKLQLNKLSDEHYDKLLEEAAVQRSELKGLFSGK